MSATCRRWVLKRRPVGEIAPGDLAFEETTLRELAPGEALVRTVYLSLDPTNRIWMSDQDQYLPPVEIGQTMRGGTLGIVEESRSEGLPKGAWVLPGLAGWESRTIVHEGSARVLPLIPGLPMDAFMSVLGATGLTAFFGMIDIGRPAAGETVVVSAAAGAVGSIAGQLAKLRGARVIGIAGGAKKCAWLTGELGFDGAIDHRGEDVGAALDRLCPDGVDVNFENVGGPVMQAVTARLNNFARMPLCGLISTYNTEGPVAGPEDFARILMRRITIRGFIVIDFLPRAAEAMSELVPLALSGRLKWKNHVVEGLENAPEALGRLFTGDHDGKLLVKVSEAD